MFLYTLNWSTRSHCVGNWLWCRLWAYRNTGYGMNYITNTLEWGGGDFRLISSFIFTEGSHVIICGRILVQSDWRLMWSVLMNCNERCKGGLNVHCRSGRWEKTDSRADRSVPLCVTHTNTRTHTQANTHKHKHTHPHTHTRKHTRAYTNTSTRTHFSCALWLDILMSAINSRPDFTTSAEHCMPIKNTIKILPLKYRNSRPSWRNPKGLKMNDK